MLMVGNDPVEAERLLVAGELVCPSCTGVLSPWGTLGGGPRGERLGRCGTVRGGAGVPRAGARTCCWRRCGCRGARTRSA
jgi:hypothetical protein